MEGISESQLGAKLSETFVDKKKLFIYTGIRTLICLIALGGGALVFWVLWLVALAIGLFPLRHLKEHLAFYEHGVCVNGKYYLFSEYGSVSVHDQGSTFMTHSWLHIGNKSINVTFLKEPKMYYNRAYLRH